MEGELTVLLQTPSKPHMTPARAHLVDNPATPFGSPGNRADFAVYQQNGDGPVSSMHATPAKGFLGDSFLKPTITPLKNHQIVDHGFSLLSSTPAKGLYVSLVFLAAAPNS